VNLRGGAPRPLNGYQIIYLDLVDLSEKDARSRLLDGVGLARAKPGAAPVFPNSHSANRVTSGEVKPASKEADSLVADASLPAEHPSRNVMSGQWSARFLYVDGEWYHERLEATVDDTGHFTARIVPSLDNHPRTGRVDHLHPERASGTVSGSRFITGVWRNPVRLDQEGAFQLRISSEEDKLVGGWLKYSDSRNEVVSGSWEWTLAGPRSDPVIAVYGVTGAGKTTLCHELVSHWPACRFFTESDVLADFMHRTVGADLRAFRDKSESERMRTREAAFTLHAERVQNSDGMLFGDAHYSFPRMRLGMIHQEHPEAEYGIQPVMPRAAWTLYTAIVYLDVSPAKVHERLTAAAAYDTRNEWAASLTVLEIQRWIEYEKRKLKSECERRGLAFMAISGDASPAELSSQVLQRTRTLAAKEY
jgi:hypothetical protein